MKYIDLEIPVKALSVNEAFQGRRFKTKKCKDFEKELWYLLPEAKTKIKGKVEIHYEFYLKNAERTDLFNLVKVVEDILDKKGYFENDRKIWKGYLKKIKSDEEKIKVIITPFFE
jgi:Holliday junction resolvase RusA-like endonuclease